MNRSTEKNEPVQHGERTHFLRPSRASSSEGTSARNSQKRDAMATTPASDTHPIKRGNLICGPRSAFARLFPEKYRRQEDMIRKQRSVSTDNSRSNADQVTIQRPTSDNEDADEDSANTRKSRRVRFYTREDNRPQIRTKSEPHLHRAHLSSEVSTTNLHCGPNPEIIYRDNPKEVVYTQRVGVRYLRPPTPPPPGPIVIREIQTMCHEDLPPIVVSGTPPIPPRTPSPLVVREQPPTPPAYQPTKVITKRLPPLPTPARRIVVKRKPPLPAKPRPVIIEKWLPYKTPPQRPILYERAENAHQGRSVQRDVIVQYEPPRVQIKQKVQTFGCFRVDPELYRAQHGPSLRRTNSIRRVLEQIGCNTDIITSTGYSSRRSCRCHARENFSHYDCPRQSTTCFTDEQLDALIGAAIPAMATQPTENHYDVPKIYNDNEDFDARMMSAV